MYHEILSHRKLNFASFQTRGTSLEFLTLCSQNRLACSLPKPYFVFRFAKSSTLGKRRPSFFSFGTFSRTAIKRRRISAVTKERFAVAETRIHNDDDKSRIRSRRHERRETRGRGNCSLFPLKPARPRRHI